MSKNNYYMLYCFAIITCAFQINLYAANDMITPVMLKVVNTFHVNPQMIPLSFLYLIWGVSGAQLLISPVADLLGRRNTIISGSILFVLVCILLALTTSMHSFLLMRVVQGICFGVTPLLYATLYSYFDKVRVIRTIAIMHNLTGIAPLIAPWMAYYIVSSFSWRMIFYISAFLGFIISISFISYTPRDNKNSDSINSFKTYFLLLKRFEFLIALILSSLITGTLIMWMAISPLVVRHVMHISLHHYVRYHFIILSGVFISTLVLYFLAPRFSVNKIFAVGLFIIFATSILMCFLHYTLWLYIALFSCFMWGSNMMSNMIYLIISKLVDNTNATLSLFSFCKSLMYAVILLTVKHILKPYHYSFHAFGWLTSFIMLLTALIGILFLSLINKLQNIE